MSVVYGSEGLTTAQKADVNAEVDSALDTAIPGVPTAASMNKLIKDFVDAAISAIDTTAMRGTDSGFLAANYLGLQFTPYTYYGAIAAGASYVPAAKTIVMVANMSGIDAADDFELLYDTIPVASVTNANGPTLRGFYGAIYCEGTNIKFKNNDDAQNNLALEGVTMA